MEYGTPPGRIPDWARVANPEEVGVKITLAMKEDWQGNAGNPVIDQGDNQDTHHDFHKLPARLHDSFFLLPPLPKHKRQSVNISKY